MTEETDNAPQDTPPPRPAARLGFVGRFRNADPVEVRRLAATTPFLWVYLVVLSIATFQIYADPLGFDGVTEGYSQQLINLTLTGPLYPNDGQEEVSVVLIEDETLEDLGAIWPWPYSEHARALDAFLAYEPRAVVVDILFADARDDPSLDQLLFVIDRYQRFGVPLYFVGSSQLDPPVRQELLNAPARVIDGRIMLVDGMARQYPETVACLEGEGENCPSLAVRVYEDLYETDIPRAGDDDTALELVWGVDTHPINRKLIEEESFQCPEDAGILTRLYRALVDVDQLQSPCPHTARIPAEALLRGVPDADVEAALSGNIVLYGARLEGSDDVAYTPANGLLAAVFVHAMALDNLISFNGKPKRNTITLFGVTLGNDTIKAIVAAFILLVGTILHLGHLRQDASTPDEETFSAKSRFAWYGMLLGMTLGSGLALYYFFGLSISNWIELIFITGLLLELLISPFLGRVWGRLRYASGLI